MFDRIWRLAQLVKGKSKGASEQDIQPVSLRDSLREPDPESAPCAAMPGTMRPPHPAGPPPRPPPPGPPPTPPPKSPPAPAFAAPAVAAPLAPGRKGGPCQGDSGDKRDERTREETHETGGPKGDSAKCGLGKGKGASLPAPRNPPKTPQEAIRPKAKNMPGPDGTGKGSSGSSPESPGVPSGSWVQCWMWLPAAGGSGIAPYLPADVASGAAPAADWGKGHGKSWDREDAGGVFRLHCFFLDIFCGHMFKHVKNKLSNLEICQAPNFKIE